MLMLKPPKLPSAIKACTDDGLAVSRYIQAHNLVFMPMKRMTVPNFNGRVITSGDKKITVADELDAGYKT